MAIKTYKTRKGECRYQVQRWKNGQYIGTKTFKRKCDAQEWTKRQDLKALNANLGRLKGEALTLSEFFHQTYAPRLDVRKGTIVDYLGMFQNYIEPEFGNRMMMDLTDEEWSLFFRTIQKSGKISNSRVNRIRTFASSLYAKAIKWKYLNSNPIPATEKFEENLPKTDYWSEEEAHRFLTAARDSANPLFSFYRTAYETGMRRGELQGLSRDSIDFENDVITIRQSYSEHAGIVQTTKGGKLRCVGMSPGLKQALQSVLASHPFDLVFCNSEGKVLTNDYIRYHFKKDVKAAGVKLIRFHSFSRHTFASHFVMKGEDLYALKHLLGHANIETTMRYAHLSPTYLRSKANVVTFQ